MWSTGKLRSDKRGIGSIIGAVFIVLILLSGYMFYAFNIDVAKGYADTLEDMQQLDLRRNKENIEFISVSIIGNRLNMTIKNSGSFQAHLIWLGIFDETVTPSRQEYHELNIYIEPAETVSNITDDDITLPIGQERVIQLVTELGNIFNYNYPPKEEDSERAYITITGINGTATYYPSSWTLLGITENVSGSVSDLANEDGSYAVFRSYYGDTITDIIDFVDETCDLHVPSAKGAHSNFTAEQYGPDLVYDTLTEEITESHVVGYKVQQGRTILTSATQDITITTVSSLNRAFVLLTGYYAYGQSDTTPTNGTGGRVNSNIGQFSAYLHNTDTIRVERSSGATNVWITWQVIECLNEEFYVYRGSQPYSGSTTTYTVSIGGTVNGSNSLAWVNGATNNQGSRNFVSQTFFTAEIGSGLQTTMTLKREAAGTASGTARWVVVEFNPNKIDSIQTGETTVTTQTQSSRRTVTISPVDTSDSILLFQIRSSANGLMQLSVAGSLDSAAQISFYTHAANSYARYIRWYVIDFGEGCGSKQNGQIDMSGEANWYDINQPLTEINKSRTISFVSLTSSGTSTAFPIPFPNAYIETTTNLNIWRSYYGQGSWIEWQVLELPCYIEPLNHELDLEVQWTNIDYNQTNEQLCIYAGAMGSESIRVDVWNGSAWTNIMTNLSTGWNNVSVSPYLSSSAFIIRFKDALDTNDAIQDSWEIDAVLLHVWTTTDKYTAEVVFEGLSNLGNWTDVDWQIDSCWDVGEVTVTIQFYNYTLGDYVSNGNGYISYVSQATPNTDESKSKTIILNPTDIRNGSSTHGDWKVRIKGVKSTDIQFLMKIDLIKLNLTYSSSGNSIPYGAWQWYDVKASAADGGPIPYAFISIYVNGTSVALRNAVDKESIPNPGWIRLNSDGEFQLELRSTCESAETFTLYAVVGSVVGKKNITQEAPR